MKHLKSYIIIAIISLSLASSHHAFAGPVKQVKSINVIVRCLECKPPVISRQTATPNKDGRYSVILPAAGTYNIIYADGPKKNQVIETATVTRGEPRLLAGHVSLIK